MELKDFIGKTVISSETHYKYIIDQIDGVAFNVHEAKPNDSGYHSHYSFMVGTGPDDNPIARGTLVFEDESLKEPCLEAFYSSINNQGRYDQYSYYMSKYD